MKTRLLQQLGIAVFFTAALAVPVRADPDFDIETGAGWSNALASGTIVPVTKVNDLADLGYDSSLFAVPTLSVSGDDLVADFSAAPDTNGVFGGFEYNFPADPDLTGKTLTLKLLPYPPDCKVSIILVSPAKNMPPPAVAGETFTISGTGYGMSLAIPANATSYTGTDANNDPVPVTITPDPGFQLTSVGFEDVIFKAPPLLPGDQPIIMHVKGLDLEVPEPSTFALLGTGAIGLLAYVARRRAKA